MKFTASSAKLSDLKTDCLILPTGSQLNNTAKSIDKSLDGVINSLLKSKQFAGKIGETLLLNLPQLDVKRLLLIGTDGDNAPQKSSRLSIRPPKLLVARMQRQRYG